MTHEDGRLNYILIVPLYSTLVCLAVLSLLVLT